MGPSNPWVHQSKPNQGWVLLERIMEVQRYQRDGVVKGNKKKHWDPDLEKVGSKHNFLKTCPKPTYVSD